MPGQIILNRISILRAAVPADVSRYAETLNLEASVLESSTLPENFPIPMDRDTREIHEIIFAYLLRRYLISRSTAQREHDASMSADEHASLSIEQRVRNSRINSAHAAAKDLADFQTYLDYFELDWFDVTPEDIDTYCDAMAETVSPLSARQYAENTVRRRENTIRHFYATAHTVGDVANPAFGKVYKRPKTAIRKRALAHTGYQRRTTVHHTQRASGRLKDPPHPMTPRQWKAIASFLGPANQTPGAPTVAHRLACETALQTALRIEEICWLTKAQFLDLTWPEDWPPKKLLVLQLNISKGQNGGSILIPIWVVKLLIAYIEGQREEDVQAGIANGNMAYDHGFLFVNGDGRPEHRGKKLTTDTLARHFNTAVVNAGHTRSDNRTDPDSGEVLTFVEAMFSFHDLRHTYVIWTHHTLLKEGHPAPFIPISKQLRHANHQITEEHYLTVSHEYEALVTDQYMGRRR